MSKGVAKRPKILGMNPGKKGVYKVCRTCRGQGYKLSPISGREVSCRKCAGDGLIRIGTQGGGRGRGRGKKSKGPLVQRAKWWVIMFGAGWVSTGELLGTLGRSVFAVLYVVFLGLAMFGSYARDRAANG